MQEVRYTISDYNFLSLGYNLNRDVTGFYIAVQ
jgi:hypothetical protein